MSSDLGLDPSDPLNLLLHNSQNPDSTSGDDNQEENGNIQDWEKFSTLWTDVNDPSSNPLKQYTDIMDFTDLSSIPMDMDFHSIEPSALHYDPVKFSNPGMSYTYDDQFGIPNDMLATQFPFTFQFNGSDISSSSSSTSSPQSTSKERRLSVTSSSSSSGASLSPVPESIPSPANGYLSDSPPPKEELSQVAENNIPNELGSAAELAQRVRQSAGVMLAVPMHMQGQNYGVQMALMNAQSKLPIPRLPRHNSTTTSKSTTSSAASTPPPSTPPPPANYPFKLALNTVSAPPVPHVESLSTPITTSTGALPRPKTSHTTIERRYRTNLNARIQSLRMAVPALRVLEDRDGGNGKKIKKNVKGGILVKGTNTSMIDSEDGNYVDIIDERGFVDGVKVARKCSKANVLGKAVEYIRVLKKREQRLKAEQEGLKLLIGGLVGGPALVREWEKEWRAKYGGEEKDEIEGEDDEDDDDSEDDEGDEGDEEGRKRKRPKVVPAPVTKKLIEKEKKKPTPAPAVVLTGEQGTNPPPEKRKRGRPRKVVPPPVPAPTTVPQVSEPLAQDAEMYPPSTPWSQAPQQPQQYLMAVFALFSFFNSPLTSTMSAMTPHSHEHTGTVLTAAHPPLAYAPDIISQLVTPKPQIPAAWTWKEYIQIFHLLVSVLVLGSFVSSWLGLSFGKAIARSRRMSVSSFNKARVAGSAGWLKMGEEYVLESRAASLSFYERFQIYRSVTTKHTASDLTTLALVLHGAPGALSGLARMKAFNIWNYAQQQAQMVHESLVFEEITFEEASSRLSFATASDRTDGEKIYTPLEVLGCLVIKDRIKNHLGQLFVNVVTGEDALTSEKEDFEEREEQWRRTIEAARALGGHIEHLGKMFERVWKTRNIDDAAELAAVDINDSNITVDGEIRALIVALVLYRCLFSEDGCDTPLSSSTLMSPPPSPTSKTSVERTQRLLALRTALGNRVFEYTEVTEDAKDRVVDMIVDVERRHRVSPTP